MNSSEKKWRQDLLILALVEPETVNGRTHSMAELNDYDKAIAECQGMFEYYKDAGNKEEMLTWKNELQKVKTEKRMIREMLLNDISEAEVLTA